MGILSKLYYHTWNIGFIEKDIKDVLTDNNTLVSVNWVKHHYRDRFFADPFILSMNESEIKVLVEDFPYYGKKGMISLLIIDRQSYKLLDKKVVLKQPYHMSYPFIFRDQTSGNAIVAPEASMSGKLYSYTFNDSETQLENQAILISEPLLDSTIVKYNNLYWLFCTKRGLESNESLYIYYAENYTGPWAPHKQNPVVKNAAMARPAGHIVEIDGYLYRVIQKCDNFYGEAVNVSRIDVLSETEFRETFLKEIRPDGKKYKQNFHTINGLDNLCVVDGIKPEFRPISRIWFEFLNLFHNR